MRTTRTGTPFLVIGENIHATRVVKRTGKHIVVDADGRSTRSRFTDPDGERNSWPSPGRSATAGTSRRARSSTCERPFSPA